MIIAMINRYWYFQCTTAGRWITSRLTNEYVHFYPAGFNIFNVGVASTVDVGITFSSQPSTVTRPTRTSKLPPRLADSLLSSQVRKSRKENTDGDTVQIAAATQDLVQAEPSMICKYPSAERKRNPYELYMKFQLYDQSKLFQELKKSLYHGYRIDVLRQNLVPQNYQRVLDKTPKVLEEFLSEIEKQTWLKPWQEKVVQELKTLAADSKG